MSTPTLTIPTPHLTLSPLSSTNPSNISFVHTLNNSPEMLHINSTLLDAPVETMSLAVCQDFVEKGEKMMQRNGYGRYLISLKKDDEDEEPVGIVSMMLERFPGAPTVPDIGFAILAEFYGRGYATEAARSVLECV